MALPVLQAFNAPYAIDQTNTRIFLRGRVIWTAQAYVSGGLLPSYSPIADVSGQNVLLPIYVSPAIGIAPDEMFLVSEGTSGYEYQYVRATGKIMIFTGAAAQSPLTELAAGALPAGVISDLVRFVASWPKQ